MIAHDVTRQFADLNSFKAVATYALRLGPQQGDPLDWGLTNDYQTEAVAWAKAVNNLDPDIGWAIKEADMVQRLNKRAVTNKTYHYVVSFPEGEQPSRAVLENIEEVLSGALGYAKHQRLMAVHRDTQNLHMHVVVNRVNPDTFKVLGTAWDHYILQRAADELEAIHGLKKENHQPGTRTRNPREPYRPTPRPRGPKRDPNLYREFQEARAQASLSRKKALDKLRVKHQRQFTDLTAWHAKRRANARAQPLSRADRKSSNLYLREAAQNDHEARRQQQAKERLDVKEQYKLLTWSAFSDANTRDRETGACLGVADRERPGDPRGRGR